MEGDLEKTREELVQKIGENVSVRRAVIYEGDVNSYVHTNGKIGVLVQREGGSDELGRDIAMHVAAANPQVVNPDDVAEDVIAKEKEIYMAQAADSGKPADIVEKMVGGRVRKFLAEISLVEQQFVKDPDTKVAKLLKDAGASIKGFTRFEVGEGIEVVEEDFAEEVRKQMGGDA
jgi:elongation factor Ts